jgi:hypothetical protein
MEHRVNVDVAELAMALDNSSFEMRYYLDLETGEVILIMDEFARELEAIYDEIYEEGRRVVTLEAHLQGRDDPDWQREMLLEAGRVEQGYGTRYIRVEPDDPYADYNDMERFIGTVEDPQLRERLWRAIKGRGAFRYFKDVLWEHPDVKEQWYEFKEARRQRRLTDWLEARNIEPVCDEEATGTQADETGSDNHRV